MKWEVDTYLGRHTGLVVLELEIPDRGYPVPSFPNYVPPVPLDVTDESRFKNRWLASATNIDLGALFTQYDINL